MDVTNRLHAKGGLSSAGDIREIFDGNATSGNSGACVRDTLGNESPHFGANAAKCSNDGSADKLYWK